MIKKNIIPFLFFLILTGNRAVSQAINIGGIYYYEFLLLFILVTKPKSIINNLKTYYPALLLILYTLFILILETIQYGASSLAFRRSALGIYVITPIIILSFHDELKKFISNNYNLIILIFAFFSIFQIGGFQPTMAAQLIGALTLFNIINFKINKRTYILIAIYLALVSGITTGQSIFRTPILTTIVAAIISYIIIKKFTIYRFLLVIFCFIFILVPIILSGVANSAIGGIALGLSGLFDSSSLVSTGISLGGDISSTRGDAAGTAQTRIMFWRSIIDYQLSNIKSFIFGYGLQNGFMEITLPNFEFNDKEITDPHNSFLNLFFRFGIVGLTLYTFMIFKIYKKLSKEHENSNGILPYLIISILFSSFEVALENPHGNIIFWIIIFIPSLFKMNNNRLKSNADLMPIKI